MDRTGVHPPGPVAELLGAICYALLHSFGIAARGAAFAPSAALADQQARFALDEFRRYEVLRGRLDAMVPDPDTAIDSLRGTMDAFYETAQAPGWVEAQVFFYVGATITTDFAELLGHRVDAETAAAVSQALTGRVAQQAFALEQIEAALSGDAGEARARIGSFVRTMVASALNRFRDALLASRSVEQVLGGPEGAKEVVLELLGRHRERLERIGLETVD